MNRGPMKRLILIAGCLGLAALSLAACTEPPPTKSTGSYAQPSADNDDAHWLLNGLLIGQMMGGNNHTTVVEHRYAARPKYQPKSVPVQVRTAYKAPAPTYRTTSSYRAPAYRPSYRPSYRASYSRR